MEPSLPGDVLLLAVGDRAGFRTAGGVETALAGALLCAELLAGRTLPGPAPGRTRRAELERLVQQRSATALEEAGRPLVRSGVLAPRTHRVLGVFPRRGFEVLGVRPRRHAEQRLVAALRPGSRPDPPAACLAVLCAVSGIARAVGPAPTTAPGRAARAAHLNGLTAVLGPQLTDVLLATRAVYRRGGSGDVFAVDDDGYGDSGDSGGDGGGGGGGD